MPYASPTKRRILAEDGSAPPRPVQRNLSTRADDIHSPSATHITVAFHGSPDNSLPSPRPPTSSPKRPNKWNLSMTTPTKRQIFEEACILPSSRTSRIAVTPHGSPGTSLPMKGHFRLRADSATTQPAIRAFSIADVPIFIVSESSSPANAACPDFYGIQPLRQSQSVHHPGFDVFV